MKWELSIVALFILGLAIGIIYALTKETKHEELIRRMDEAIARMKDKTEKVLTIRTEFEKDESLVSEKKQEDKLSRIVYEMSSETYAAYREIPTVENARLSGVRQSYSSSCGIDVHDTKICVTDNRPNRNVCFHYATGETRCVEDTKPY